MTPNARTCSRTNRPRQRPSSQDRQPSPLLVTSLGGTGIWSDSRSVQIGWKRALTLFYFLLEHPDGVHIDTICHHVWWDTAMPALSRIRTAVYHLRNAFGSEIVKTQRDHYKLNRDDYTILYDVELFMRGSDPATMPLQEREQTLSIYKGPFLPELDAPWAGLNLCAALQVRWPFFDSFQLRVFFDYLTDGSEILLHSIPGDPLLVEGVLSSRQIGCLHGTVPERVPALRVRALRIARPEPDDEPDADVLLEGRVVRAACVESNTNGIQTGLKVRPARSGG